MYSKTTLQFHLPSFDIIRLMFGDYLQKVLGDLALLLVVGQGAERFKDPHGLVVSGLSLRNLLEALGRVLHVSSVDVHLAQVEVRKNKVRGCELFRLFK